MCYLNDDCVSLNFKKDPDYNEPVNICELNNATRLKYDSDLTTDTIFLLLGLEGELQIDFSKLSPWTNTKTLIDVYANSRAFGHSVFRFFFIQTVHLSFVFHCFFFLLQNACDKCSQCRSNATCQSGFTLEGYRCLCPPAFEGELCRKS